jgi:hypothetical protein
VGVGLKERGFGAFGGLGFLPRYIGEEILGAEDLVHQDPCVVDLVVVEGHEEDTTLGEQDAQ